MLDALSPREEARNDAGYGAAARRKRLSWESRCEIVALIEAAVGPWPRPGAVPSRDRVRLFARLG